VNHKIFPNADESYVAPFKRQQLAALLANSAAELEVMATIPWFPRAGTRSRGRRGKLATVSARVREQIAGIAVKVIPQAVRAEAATARGPVGTPRRFFPRSKRNAERVGRLRLVA